MTSPRSCTQWLVFSVSVPEGVDLLWLISVGQVKPRGNLLHWNLSNDQTYFQDPDLYSFLPVSVLNFICSFILIPVL